MTPPPAEEIASRLFVGPALRAQPDRRLVRLVRDGYEAAFEEIVRRYGRPLGRYAAAIVGGRSEDVTQDAFSKALLALRRDDAEIELRPWLYRIVRNTALNDLRDRPPAPEALAETLSGGRGPADEVEQREELAELTRRLRALPEPQRAAIVMRELEGLGHEEIAAALGLSGGAVRQAIYRARQALRDGLGLLVPLPLLRSMLEAGAAGPIEAAGGAAGAAGAGLALKAGAATVLVVGAVGAGVALHGGGSGATDQPPTAQAAAGGDTARGGDLPFRQASGSASRTAGGDRTGNRPARAGGGQGAPAAGGSRRGSGGGGRSGDSGGEANGDNHQSGGERSGQSSGDGAGSGHDSPASGGGSEGPSGEASEGSGGTSGDSGQQQPSGDGELSGTGGGGGGDGGGSDSGSGSGGDSGSESGSGTSDLNGAPSLGLPLEESPPDS